MYVKYTEFDERFIKFDEHSSNSVYLSSKFSVYVFSWECVLEIKRQIKAVKVSPGVLLRQRRDRPLLPHLLVDNRPLPEEKHGQVAQDLLRQPDGQHSRPGSQRGRI